jgi:hypothetical protein
MQQAEVICTLLIVVAALAILAKKVALRDHIGIKRKRVHDDPLEIGRF